MGRGNSLERGLWGGGTPLRGDYGGAPPPPGLGRTPLRGGYGGGALPQV